MRNLRLLYALIIFMVLAPLLSMSQDSLKVRTFIPKKNVIHYVITPHIFGFKSAILGYERVVKPYQSFSINAGFIALGSSNTSTNDNLKTISSRSSGGYMMAVDYRFYLKRENRDPAPHGIYLAPFYSHYSFHSDREIQLEGNTDLNAITSIDTRLNINNLGIELGYQFIIKNRFTIDMVLFGPSVSGYKLNMDFSSGFKPPDMELNEDLIAIRDALFDKYPWMKTLVEEGSLDAQGKTQRWGMGFRYVIQIGYRF